MIIDTHIHIWDTGKSSYGWLAGAPELLKRTYAIGELDAARKTAGIAAGIFVQADVQMEDSFHMLDVAGKTDWIKGVVSWLPLADPRRTAMLLEQRLLKDEYFVGVRHLIHDEKDPKWLLQPAAIESLKMLAAHRIPYDVIGVLPEHIETVLKVAELVPELQMVFDHLNAPPVSSGARYGQWGVLMQEVAKNKNIYAKISGLGTVAGTEKFTAETLTPYIGFVLEHFDTDRCFCGGDWPVSLLAGDYVYTWEVYKNVLSSLLSGEALENVYAGNAIRFYDLKLD
ncbi:amidohydrolase family protein [Niabella drilacis]|uniref:L-fuconolactonase n=1 Tax=Niabella drilacis (strain DSM 25811 / CCM 8410 / CCUG 62505 / LMG 26954 / E90) TaxID=1285928 RepID=A0A1G6ZRZ5_NIADE|nr:amidohydrolase family protein [Niabella drilacis]SDE05163.1 L-fuconolactonase [Niabella drilacis]